MKKLFLFLLFLAPFASHLFAQTSEVYGYISDSSKQPLLNVIITAEQSGNVKGSTQTDSEGGYSIKPLQPGRYDVKIQSPGYETIIITAVVAMPDHATKVNFKLCPGDPKKEMIVKYVRSIIDPAKIEEGNIICRFPAGDVPTRNSVQTSVYKVKIPPPINLNDHHGTLYLIDSSNKK